jgi:large subunit ribosomal protein L3
MKFILGKKIGMTQIWKDEKVVSVTKIQAGPCLVTQVKDENKDGYRGVQLAFDLKKEKNIKKPQKGHFLKIKKENKNIKTNWKYLREFRLLRKENEGQEMNAGSAVCVDTFEPGDKVDISGTSKGRGFQGVVKRHNFSGASKTHGTKDQERMPGSAGAMGVGRIFKGKRMPGRMGNKTITTKNLEIVDIDIDNNILFIKGAVAGAVNGLVTIKGQGELKINSAEEASGVLEKSSASGKQESAEEKQATKEQDAKEAPAEVKQEKDDKEQESAETQPVEEAPKQEEQEGVAEKEESPEEGANKKENEEKSS